MSSLNSTQELEFLADRLISNFGIKTHKDLKNLLEFKSLPEDSQRKLYDRVRYKTQKGNLKLVTSTFTIETDRKIAKTKNSKLDIKKQIKNLPTVLLLALIFCFLTSESFKFYDQFEILPFFQHTIPIIIEFSVLLLSFKKSKLAMIMLSGLIVFNTATFTYKTIECDKNIKREREEKLNRVNFLKEQRHYLEIQDHKISSELLLLKNQYNDLIAKNFFKMANGTYFENIKSEEGKHQLIQDKLEKIKLELLNSGVISKGNSLLSTDTIFMIILKCILQAVFVFLIFDLKKVIGKVSDPLD